MEADTKKKLLYGGGALASIVALVLYMKNKQASAQPMPALGSGVSGAGGVSSGTGANNANALNAAVALAVEQSRQQNALQVAQLQSQTALQIAGLQTSSAQSIAQSQALKSAVGPGGAATSALGPGGAGTDLIKGIVGGVNGLLAKWFGNPSGVPSTDITSAGFGVGATPYGFFGDTALYPESSQQGYYVMSPNSSGNAGNFGLPDFTNYTSEPSNYVQPGVYDFFGGSAGPADYYQGSIGGGDSSYFGDNSFNYGDLASQTSEAGGTGDGSLA